ncbi:AMP-binding protein [Yinghuangia aomiensis]
MDLSERSCRVIWSGHHPRSRGHAAGAVRRPQGRRRGAGASLRRAADRVRAGGGVGVVAAGVERGDQVAVWAPNSKDWIVAGLGALAAGATIVPMNCPVQGLPRAQYVLRRRAPSCCSSPAPSSATSRSPPCCSSSRPRGHRPRRPAFPPRCLDLTTAVVLADSAPDGSCVVVRRTSCVRRRRPGCRAPPLLGRVDHPRGHRRRSALPPAPRPGRPKGVS